MQKHYYLSHYEDTEVTDAAIIRRLEKDDPPEKNASINRPVKMTKQLAKLLESRRSGVLGKKKPHRLRQQEHGSKIRETANGVRTER
jgi:hypothetical protein